MLRIILVRHGQTEWNQGGPAGEHFRGRIDLKLNTTGVAQARAVAERLAPVRIKAVYSSPLQRALETARPIVESQGLAAVEPLAGLMDIDYGHWGGRSHKEVAAQWPDMYQRWRSQPHLLQVPGGEGLSDVRMRVRQALQQVIERHDREIIVMVGHQVVNKVMICTMLGLDNSAFWRIRQDTCCINRFDHDGDAFTVLTLNEVCHLSTHSSDLDELPAYLLNILG